MNAEDKKLMKSIKYAVKQTEEGHPLKDFLDDDEISDGLILLVKLHKQFHRLVYKTREKP